MHGRGMGSALAGGVRVRRSYPLTQQQEIIWFNQVAVPVDTAYNFTADLHFERLPPREQLRSSFLDMCARHPMLTGWVEWDSRTSGPIFVYDDDVDRVVDAFVEVKAESSRADPTILELNEPFDMSHGPLVRWRAMRERDGSGHLFHQEHHLIHDGVSFNLLLDSLGGISPQDGPAYREYALAQQKEGARLPPAPLMSRLVRLSRTLRAAPIFRPAGGTEAPPASGVAFRHRVPAEATAVSEAIAADLKVSAFAVWRWAFTVAMNTLFEMPNEWVLGCAVANRPFGHERTVGMFVQTVPTVVSHRPALDGESILRAALEMTAGLDLARFSMSKWVDAEKTQGDRGLIQISFSAHRQERSSIEISGETGRITPGIGNSVAKFDLNVILVEFVDSRRFELVFEGRSRRIKETGYRAIADQMFTALAKASELRLGSDNLTEG